MEGRGQTVYHNKVFPTVAYLLARELTCDLIYSQLGNHKPRDERFAPVRAYKLDYVCEIQEVCGVPLCEHRAAKL